MLRLVETQQLIGRDTAAMLKIATLLAYAACIGLVVFGLFRARQGVVQTYGGTTAEANWQLWRSAAEDSNGLVERDPPKSDLPPAFLLMRDHFNTCLAFSILMTSVLFMTIVFMIRGAFFYEQPAAYQLDESLDT